MSLYYDTFIIAFQFTVTHDRNLQRSLQTNKAIQALNNLGCATEHWNDYLVFLIAQKLDKSSRKAWELKLGDTVDYSRTWSISRILHLTRLHSRTQWRSHRRSPKGQLSPYIRYLSFHSCAYYAKRNIYCINVLCSSSKLHLNILNSLKMRETVWTVLERSMLWKII